MSLYLPVLTTLTDDELLRYAAQYATTDLEKALVERFERLHDNPERIPSVETLKDKAWGIADKLSDTNSLGKKDASEALFDAITQFEAGQA